MDIQCTAWDIQTDYMLYITADVTPEVKVQVDTTIHKYVQAEGTYSCCMHVLYIMCCRRFIKEFPKGLVPRPLSHLINLKHTRSNY